MEALPFHERVTLVVHSYGGYAISQAMEYFPSKISVVVFATAFMLGCTDTPFLVSCRCLTHVEHWNGYDVPDSGVRQCLSFFSFSFFSSLTRLQRIRHANNEKRNYRF